MLQFLYPPSATLVPLKQGDSFLCFLNSSPVLGEVVEDQRGYTILKYIIPFIYATAEAIRNVAATVKIAYNSGNAPRIRVLPITS